MNKIVMLIGTNRTPSQSNSYQVANMIKERLFQRNKTIQVEILGLTQYRIDMCKGCECCFKTGKCSLNDDMEKLKKTLWEADHIMVISPVYAHHIPGILKNTIDRISYWTHVIKLLGKTSSSIAVTSSNGQIYVSDYLEKILKLFGTIYVSSLEITIDDPPMLGEIQIETNILIDNFVKAVEQSLTGYFPLDDLDTQIEAFNLNKKIYSHPQAQGFEGNSWKIWPELLHDSFLDAWQYQRMKNEWAKNQYEPTPRERI